MNLGSHGNYSSSRGGRRGGGGKGGGTTNGRAKPRTKGIKKEKPDSYSTLGKLVSKATKPTKETGYKHLDEVRGMGIRVGVRWSLVTMCVCVCVCVVVVGGLCKRVEMVYWWLVTLYALLVILGHGTNVVHGESDFSIIGDTVNFLHYPGPPLIVT